MTNLDEVLAAGLNRMADDAPHDHDLAGTIRRRSRYRRAVTVAPIAAAVAVVGLLTTVLLVRPGSTNATPSAASACDGSVVTAVIPSWARAGFSEKEPVMPYATSTGGAMVALIFNDPLTSPTAAGTGNKILWVTNVDEGSPLQISGRLEGGTQSMQQELSAPGPSGIEVPAPGCWQFTLDWATHHETISIPFTAPPVDTDRARPSAGPSSGR